MPGDGVDTVLSYAEKPCRGVVLLPTVDRGRCPGNEHGCLKIVQRAKLTDVHVTGYDEVHVNGRLLDGLAKVCFPLFDG